MDGQKISFRYNGVDYEGVFAPVGGGGALDGVWHLYVQRFYWGRLRCAADDHWYFDATPAKQPLTTWSAAFAYYLEHVACI